MQNDNFDSEGKPVTPRWDGYERRKFPRNGKNGVTPLTLDQKLDRFLKVATIIKFVILPCVGGIGAIAYMNHRTLETLGQQIATTNRLILEHDKTRRDRDQTRLQIHHQSDIVSGRGGCIRCKLHDRLSGGELFEGEPDIAFTR